MWNKCCINHPCPIFCGLLTTCTNDVINPIMTANYAYFNNTSTITTPTLSNIPVFFSIGEGTAIAQSSSTAGAVSIAPGTYEVSYFANATLPASGTASLALSLNGAVISGSQIDSSGTASQTVTLSQTVMISVTQSSTLALFNSSADALTTTLASMTIKKL